MLHLLLVLVVGYAFGFSASSPHYLRLTAVVSDEKDDHAKFECWEMCAPFSSYPTVGDSISGLADVTNVSYVVLPPRSKEGLHKPPHPMFFVLLSGLAHVTLPDGDDELYIMEGVNALIVAADVRGDGHYTNYPSDKASVALQIPFQDGEVPEHRLVNDGACEPVSTMYKGDLDGVRLRHQAVTDHSTAVIRPGPDIPERKS